MCFQCESEPQIRILEHVYLMTSAIEENLTCVDGGTCPNGPSATAHHRRMSLFTGAATRRLASNWSRHILYVDRGVVVLNKPSGLICQADRPLGDSIQVRNISFPKAFLTLQSQDPTKFKECLNSQRLWLPIPFLV